MHFTHKNIALIVVSALVIGGAFVLAEYRNSKSKKVVYSAPVTAVIDALPLELQTLDSDKDDLKDWEEILLGTDPKKADTDGDGTSDGKETATGRNPLIKGPNDKATDTPRTTISSDPNLTQTDKLARDFFAHYVELKQAGMSNDKDSQAEITNTLIQNGLLAATPKLHTPKEIKTKVDNSVAAKTLYGNEIGLVFKQNQLLGRDEAVIAKESQEQEDPEILKEIDPIIAKYKAIIAGLLKISVPSDIASLHLDLINAVSRFLFVAESYRQMGVDPIRGLQGAKEHIPAGQALADAFQAIRNLLLGSGIKYAKEEPGNMFTN